jgi:hypothetical protein
MWPTMRLSLGQVNDLYDFPYHKEGDSILC